MAMQFFPLFEDTKLQWSGANPFNYYIQINGETVYRGRAWKSPNEATIGINVRRIAQDFLDNHKDILLDGVEKQEEAYGEVYLYDASDDTLVAYYGVLFDSYAPWSGQSMTLSEPVNGHMDPRMRIPYSRYNQTGTTIGMETEDIYFFDADDYVIVAWDAGQAVVPISTNRWLNDITVSLPSGVTVLDRSMTGWTFSVPRNYEESSVTYTVNWYVKGELVDTTVITVGAFTFEFECEQTETADPYGSVVDVWFTTSAPLFKISASVSSGATVSALTDGHLYVSVPQNETGSARTITASFIINGNVVGTCTISQAYEEGWIFSASPSKIPWSGGTYVLPISSNKPVSEITVDTPTGITYVSKTQTGFTFTVEPNIALTERTFVLTFHWKNQTRTVTLTQEKVYFEIDGKDVWGSGGDHLFWFETNLDSDGIGVVLPAGVSAVTLADDYFNTDYLKYNADDPYALGGKFFAFKFPENTGSTAIDYTFSFTYSGVTVGTMTVQQVGEHTDHSGDYLTIRMNSGGDLKYVADDAGGYIEYSVDNGAWQRMDVTVANVWLTVTGVTGSHSIRLRSTSPGLNPVFSATDYDVYGNILSMTYGDQFIGKTDTTRTNDVVSPETGWFWCGPRLHQFAGSGKDFSGLVIPLQSVLLYQRADYSSQLSNMLPVATITNAPQIRFAVVYEFGLYGWLDGASNLVALPDIKVSFGGAYAFGNMFHSYCPVASQAPASPKIHIRRTNGSTFYRMFAGSYEVSDEILGITECAEFLHHINTIVGYNPDSGGRWEVPSTFDEMYKGCGAMTKTYPVSLAVEGYGKANYQWFSPFDEMYAGCYALVSAQTLSINYIRRDVFKSTFGSCNNLVSVRVEATGGDGGTYSQSNWLQNVANSGTIYKSGNFSLPSGVSGVPSGWTVQNI